MKTVVLGMSGGVDSAVSAWLLKQQGYNVIALFMHNWEETDGDNCTAEQDYEDVKRVSDRLGIPYYSVNFAKQYQERVFSYFLEEYKRGRTPNPDVLCNREIKFGPFLQYAKALGADFIATGHYCGIAHENGKHFLLKAKDQDKDQTYFLNQLSQEQLADVIFPLADVKKGEVRKIADELNLVNAKKKDSTGICFIGERNFRKFLQNYLPSQSGEIVDVDGNHVGEHIGLMYYTLGQRRGLGLGGTTDGCGRWFVVDKDMANNRLVVSHGDESVLMSNGLVASSVNWIPAAPAADKFHCNAKFRYRQPEQGVTVEILDGGSVKVTYDESQRAVTPGQFVVFYDETKCLGGGIIDEVYKG
ncbi:MAG: tRNA 2-thiouridine(34) synthase MnmA [Clostridiales bacterium]|nr:tRNA 2-thiouridine(34) synthase MnmA [Clostridiales bacterium]